MTAVTTWTGREANALRKALRLSMTAFAEHLGVAERTVAKWSSLGDRTCPRGDIQIALDTVLARATPEVRERFEALRTVDHSGATVRTARPDSDAEDLTLIRANQMERDAVVVDFTARLLAGLVCAESLEAVRRVLVEVLPWVTFLPDTDVDQLLSELVTIAQGAASVNNLTPVAVLLGQWRHTAVIYSDPRLLEIISREPEGDLGPAQRPAAQRDRAAPPPIGAEHGPRIANFQAADDWEESIIAAASVGREPDRPRATGRFARRASRHWPA